MAKPGRSFLLIAASSVLLLGAAACSTAATSAPAKPAATPSASSAAASPTKAATAATTSTPAAAAASSSSGEIRIGGLFSITGAAAGQSPLYMNAAKLAVNQINAKGGINGKKIDFVTEDTQSTDTGALAALQRMIEIDKPLVILGPVFSTQIQAMSNADKAAGIPMATGGTAVKNTHMGNPWIFRLRPDDSIAAAAMVKYIKEDMKLTKVGIIYSNEAFGQGGSNLVEQYAKEQGLTVVKKEGFTPGTKDYTAQLLAIKTAGAQVLVVYAAGSDDNAVIEQQYKNLGSPYQFMGNPGCVMQDSLKLAKNAAVGLHAVSDYMPGVTDVSKKYEAAYQKAYGQPADATAAYNYDAVNLFAKAIAAVGENRSKIMKYILGIHGTYEGAVGTFNFTPNGDGLHSNTVVQIEPNDQLKFVKVVTLQPSNP